MEIDRWEALSYSMGLIVFGMLLAYCWAFAARMGWDAGGKVPKTSEAQDAET